MLSRISNPLANPNRWTIAQGSRILRDYDGRVFMFPNRKSVVEYLEIFRLFNDVDNKLGFRAVPLPFTLNGKEYNEMLKTLTMVAIGCDDENSPDYGYAPNVFRTIQKARSIAGTWTETMGNPQDYAAQVLAALKDQGHDPSES